MCVINIIVICFVTRLTLQDFYDIRYAVVVVKYSSGYRTIISIDNPKRYSTTHGMIKEVKV